MTRTELFLSVMPSYLRQFYTDHVWESVGSARMNSFSLYFYSWFDALVGGTRFKEQP